MELGPDHVLSLQKIMKSNSELEYITEQRNIVPSKIEQLRTELTGNQSEVVVYKSTIVVPKKSVDYLKKLGYNLFQQFDSEMHCEYFDRLMANEDEENATVKFALETTLEYTIEIFTYGIRSQLSSSTNEDTDFTSSSEYHSDSFDTIFLPSEPFLERKTLFPTQTTTYSSTLDIYSKNTHYPGQRVPEWRCTTRFPTCLPPLVSSEEDSSDSDGIPSGVGIFLYLATLRSSVKDRCKSVPDIEDLNSVENTIADHNYATPPAPTTQKCCNASTMDSSISSDTMINVKKAVEREHESSGTIGTEGNFTHSTLKLYDVRSDENNKENDFSAAIDGQMEYRNTATSSLSSTRRNDISTLDSLENVTPVKMECINSGKSSYQPTWTNYNPSTSGSNNADIVENECRNKEESRLPLTSTNNFYESPKANAIWKEGQFDTKSEDCVMGAVSFDTSQENSKLNDLEHADSSLLKRKNTYFSKHVSLKRSAPSPAISPRSSFRSLQNSIKGRVSQPDLTDSNSSRISNFPGISTSKEITSSNADTFNSKSRESSREIFATASHCELEEREHPENLHPEESSECAQRQVEDLGKLKRQNSLECKQDRKGSSEWGESEHSAHSATISGLANSEMGLIPITNDDQVTGAGKIIQSLVWNRKYFESKTNLGLSLAHPFLYIQEYKRIRQSRLSVFDCLMSRQRYGPLNQRKVMEVIARPYYSIFPPQDEEDIKRCSQLLRSDEEMIAGGYLMLYSESSRTFDSYPCPLQNEIMHEN